AKGTYLIAYVQAFITWSKEHQQILTFAALLNLNMVEVNIQKYKRRALKKKKDLSKFMRDLSQSKTRGLLKIAIDADKEVWKEVSCVNCANCCKTMTPTYTAKDVNRIAKHFK